MESEEGRHVINALKQAMSRGNSLDIRHIRRQLGNHVVETIGEQSCLAVKERVIS